MSESDRPSPTPRPWLPVLAPATGRSAVAAYLRAHLYGAAIGRRLLERCIAAVPAEDRVRLVPLRGQFDVEVATARRLLAEISWIGTPGRQVLGMTSRGVLAVLPAGPRIVDPLTRLALLEALRTLVVAKRSMWELLATIEHLGPENKPELEELAHQAVAQAEILEALRVDYGRAALG